MTDLLYLEDSYLGEFIAKIVSVDGKNIVLDKTCFYPAGGGQPCDLGIIKTESAEYNVINVKKDANTVIHEVDKEGLKVNDVVTGQIDWNRRYKLMRSHTAMHILASVIEEATGALITGNQMDTDVSRVDVNMDSLNKEQVQEYVNKANEILQQNHKITTEFTTRENALKDQSLFKLVKGFPEHIQNIRIVSIGTANRQADGGTHVRSTSEVGKIEFVDCENKGKGRKRVYFKIVLFSIE